jgi:putative DNA primase/helicase
MTPRAYLTREKYLGEESPITLHRDHKGEPLPSLANVAAILEGERSDLHFDTFLTQMRCHGRQWTDADDLALAKRLQGTKGLGRVPLQIVAQGAMAYAAEHARNCVVDFLEGLTWDGTPRIEAFFIRAMGAEDTEYTRAVGRNFWRALVARPLQPGCQSDAMVVLEGEQGIRKSSACRVIAGDWFADTDQMPGNKDFCILLQGKLLVELGEMHAFSRAEVTAVKTAVSRRVDSYRAPFGRHSKDHPRQGSLIGTTNQFEWAQDPTGGRRFWPIRCKRIDLEWLVSNRSQLFAEAVRDVRAGLPWHEVPQEAAAAEQEARYQADLWEDVVRDWLARTAKTETTSAEIVQQACNKDASTVGSGDARRVAAIMRRLGWVLHRTERARVWRAP